jgi:RHS repeat-associated protein
MGSGARPRFVGRVVACVRAVGWRAALALRSVPVALVLVGVVAALGSHADRAPAQIAPARPEPELLGPASVQGSPFERELVELRSRVSRTYEAGDGSRVARVFSGAVNFHGDDGRWAAIDNRLVAAAGGYRNAANRYRLQLPANLSSEAVRVSDGETWVSWRLVGADAPARVAGARASYADALDGVDVTLAAGAESVKEALVLRDPKSVREFVYELEVSTGLSPRARDSGTVDLVDERGAVVMALPAPFMVDAAGGEEEGVGVSLERAGAGWRLTYRPSASWLDAPERRWPVTIDPGVNVAPDQDCYIESADANSSMCAADSIKVGYGSTSGTPHHHRGLVRFDVQAAVPAGTDVLHASMGLYLRAQTGTASKRISAHRVTRSWTNGTTWNRYDGTNAWQTPGGDFEATEAAAATVGGGSGVGRYYTWTVGDLVERWAKGEPNHGLLLKDASTIEARMEFNSREHTNAQQLPYLDISYDPRVGEQRGWLHERFELSDRISLGVNMAGGNLLLRQRDLTVGGGLGPDMTLALSYNSLEDSDRAFGFGVSLDTAEDVRLGIIGDYAKFYGPTGYKTIFKPKYDANGNRLNEYATPRGFSATLVRNTDGTRTLTWHSSQEKWKFDSSHRLGSVEDRNGRALTFTYPSGSTSRRLVRITDHLGRQTNVTRSTGGWIESIVDPAGRTYAYDQEPGPGGHYLEEFIDPDGGITRYGYTSGKLTKVTTPGGRVTDIEYHPAGDPNAGRVRAVIRRTTSTTDVDPRWEFSYVQNRDGSGHTIVKDARGHDTRHDFDTHGRVTKATDALGHARSQKYTSNSNVESYSAPSNTGTTPNTTWSFDQDDNADGSTTPAGGGRDITTSASFGSGGGVGSGVQGARWLPGTSTNAQGRTTTFAYNADGNPTSVRDQLAAQNEITMHYDTSVRGKLIGITDKRGHRTDYGYDANGNVNRITPPTNSQGTLLGHTEMTFKPELNRLETVKNGRGETTTLSYDPLDRLTKQTYGDGSFVQYVYDRDGNLTQEIDSVGGTSTNTYDDLGRLTYESLPGGRSNSYTYDRVGNLLTITDAGGTTTYGYDNANRNTSVSEPGVSQPVTFSYDDDDQRTKTTYPNGVFVDWTWDQANRLTAIEARKTGAAAALQRFTYTYQDASQRETGLRHSFRDVLRDETTRYLYDPLDRLIRARTLASGTTPPADTTDCAGSTSLICWDYEYDGASNRTREAMIGGQVIDQTTTYSYNQTNQLLSRTRTGGGTTTTSSYSYDANGNEISNGAGRTLTYNRRDQTTAIGATAIGYLGAGQDRQVAEGGKFRQFNVLGLGTIERPTGGSWHVARDENGNLLSQRSGSERYYYLSDALGSITGLTDTSGNLAANHRYQPYGTDLASTGTNASEFRYAAGHPTSGGLYHYGQRYYDPTDGRWTQRDPLDQYTDLVESNAYAYVGGNPINLVDPLGMHGANTNGCTNSPDSGPGFNFHRSCDGHDLCYNARRGRAFCDEGFRKAMRRSCASQFVAATFCLGLAEIYYRTVRVFGGRFYPGDTRTG